MHKRLLFWSISLATLAATLGGCGVSVGGDDGSDAAMDAATDTARLDVPTDTQATDVAPRIPIGDPCTDDNACPYRTPGLSTSLPACINDNRWPNGNLWMNGYCSAYCSPPPTLVSGAELTQRECPSGSLCAPFNDEAGVCLRECSGDADCRNREDYFCRRDFGVGTTLGRGVCASRHCSTRGCVGRAGCDC